MIHRPRRVDKPWGHELIWAEAEQYVGKILHVHAGEALSLQYHEVKDETLWVMRGRLKLRIGSDPESLEEYEMTDGDSVRLRPGVVHGMEAITDCDVLEASTNHLDDIVRLEDRYGRGSQD